MSQTSTLTSMKEETWLAKASKATREHLRANMRTALLQEHAISLDPDAHAGTAGELAALPPWHRSATTKTATNVAPTGAAILPKSVLANDDLPHVTGWRKILREIGRAHGDAPRLAKGLSGYVADLLRDVEFQHHQSTNGRWNDALNRWERHGVRSVDGWRGECPVRTFQRNKDKLVAAGLIVARSHLWRGRSHLWITPTEELSRILFEPGHWETVRGAYVTSKPARKTTPATARAARGLSAKHAEIDAELQSVYRDAVAGKLTGLSKAETWAVWDRLTKPIKLGQRYEKAPFAARDTHRWKRLHSALGLQWT